MKDLNDMDDEEFELTITEMRLAQRREQRQYAALLVGAGLFSLTLLTFFAYAISRIWN